MKLSRLNRHANSQRKPKSTDSERNMGGISTTKRYIYINLYAWILLIYSVIIALIPLYKITVWLIALQAAIILPMTIFAIQILKQFPRKQREYRLLIERNKEQLRPDSFWLYADAPCGRLLMWLVLKDLGYNRSIYRSIVKKYK